MTNSIAFIKKRIPVRVGQAIKSIFYSREERKKELELGMFILDRARALSRDIGGRPEALNIIQDFIKQPNNLLKVDETHQYLQTMFTTDYERNLYEYYQQQQYLMLMHYLGYPFRGPGRIKLTPFVRGSEKLKKMRILDYGSGLPFGIIHLLMSNPETIDAITLVDLDLVHTKLAEYIISTSAPDKDFRIYRLRNAEEIPAFGDRQFNFLYADNIFEHLHKPECVLSAMLERAQEKCICYFDFSDHGQRYLQHVHPVLANLKDIVLDSSFTQTGYYHHLLEFTRNLE